MDSLIQWLWHDGKFLGIEWHVWKIIGWVGNIVFFSRFMVQWYATEKRKQVMVPPSFWWLSVVGSLLMLAYALFSKRDSVLIFAYAFNWIPYVRNLVIHYRHLESHVACSGCARECPPQYNFCPACGGKLTK